MGLNSSFAQFTAAISPQISHGSGILPRNTESDELLSSGGDYYRVSVFGSIGNNNGGMCWDVLYNGISYTNSLSFGLGNVEYADVSLIEDPAGNIYAVTVYAIGGKYFFENYLWNGTGFNSIGRIVFFGSSAFGTALHIDASINGD